MRRAKPAAAETLPDLTAESAMSEAAARPSGKAPERKPEALAALPSEARTAVISFLRVSTMPGLSGESQVATVSAGLRPPSGTRRPA